MKEILLYGHGGSYNHGAEAIVKTTISLLREICPDCRIKLSTHFKEQDIEFSIQADEFCERDMHYLALDRESDVKGLYDELIYKQAIDCISKDTICLSVGGDNYCYPGWQKWAVIHNTAIKRGAKSVLWSCSIDPDAIDAEMFEVLKSHHLITARESITYSVLRKLGLENVVQCADIAFELPSIETVLPVGFIPGRMVAINISPLVIRRESAESAVVKNVRSLVDFVLSHTKMGVVFVPHVVMPVDNDCDAFKALELHKSPRICFASNDLTAGEYKYIISKCRFGVFARTHATIAAYSTGVPCIALGYSTKAEGIARDLGLSEYVVPISELVSGGELLQYFVQLKGNEVVVKSKLEQLIDSYVKQTRSGVKLII